MKESDSFAREERIRAKAYQIWLDEGCPDGGRDEAHWESWRASSLPSRTIPNLEECPSPTAIRLANGVNRWRICR